MNILVIGNGFDLEHKLATKYSDFLEIILTIRDFEEYDEEQNKKIEDIINVKIWNNITQKDNILVNKMKKLSQKNFWVQYFEVAREEMGQTWIDFESKIGEVIKDLGKDIIKKCLIKVGKAEEIRYSEIILVNICINKNENQIKEILEEDLDDLIRMLELYLIYITEIEVKKIKLIEDLSIEKILSFNYTNTYEKVYGKNKTIECDYIHGNIDINRSKKVNNMVLGMDEYLNDNEKNKDLEMIYFKKYFQRIYKKTGNEYRKWIECSDNEYKKELEASEKLENARINNGKVSIFKDTLRNIDENKKIKDIYIFGHSLDVTDRDILERLLNVSKSRVIIFYWNQDDYRAKITNLVKVIGQDKLIKKTGGINPTIMFVDQNEELDELKAKGIIDKMSTEEVVFN